MPRSSADYDLTAVRAERDRLRVRVAELEAEVEHARAAARIRTLFRPDERVEVQGWPSDELTLPDYDPYAWPGAPGCASA